jgi:hypothetical protein
VGIVWGLLGRARLEHFSSPGEFPSISFLALSALAWGVVGGIAGAAFSTLLVVRERRRSLEALSPWRVAVWGGLGGLIIPAALIGHDLLMYAHDALDVAGAMTVSALSVALGAGCAALTLALARRGIRHELAVSDSSGPGVAT